MALPLILGAAALLAGGYGVKKGVDGYKDHSEADEIVEGAKYRYESAKSAFDKQDKSTQQDLDSLGKLELNIGKRIDEFKKLSEHTLEMINEENKGKNFEYIDFPREKLEKIEKYTFTALGVLGSVAGAGTAGVAAGFAVYGGVMSFAAASTGTAISALSGVAATNATLAAIGGGSLAAGGLGMAGGTAILGATVAAPVLAIAGWAYASHGEKALENAKKASREVDDAVKKLTKASNILLETTNYIKKITASINSNLNEFNGYFDKLNKINKGIGEKLKQKINPSKEDAESVKQIIHNGYSLAAILVDVITTPVFKLKTIDHKNTESSKTIIEYIKDANGIPVMEKDNDGLFILNKKPIDDVIVKSDSGRKKLLQPIF